MKLLTGWQTWWLSAREEYKFHCDLILEPSDRIELVAPDGLTRVIVAPPGKYVKVHMGMSWEERDTLFAEEASAEVNQEDTAKPTARPHKFLDAAALEQWAEKFAPELFSEWELSDACEYLDFWEWFELNSSDGFDEFERWYREGGAEDVGTG